jgi:hypothetical protein
MVKKKQRRMISRVNNKFLGKDSLLIEILEEAIIN